MSDNHPLPLIMQTLLSSHSYNLGSGHLLRRSDNCPLSRRLSPTEHSENMMYDKETCITYYCIEPDMPQTHG